MFVEFENETRRHTTLYFTMGYGICSTQQQRAIVTHVRSELHRGRFPLFRFVSEFCGAK
jgi:hypothetical protein